MVIQMSCEHNKSTKRGFKRKILSMDHESHANSMGVDMGFVPKSTEEIDREKKIKSILTVSFWDPGMSASMVKEKPPHTMP